MTKFCPSCETKLPREAFNKNRARYDGLASYCKECRKAEARYMKDEHYAAYRRSAKGRYKAQKHNAARRGVEFLLTFEEWLGIWGDMLEFCGKEKHDLCMARNGDTGPYAVGNVRIVAQWENIEEQRHATTS